MASDYAKFKQSEFVSKQRPVTKARITKYKAGNVGGHVRNFDRDFFVNELADPSFNDFVGRAYSSEDGVAFRINPDTGEKEMMIAGTRSVGQWGLNALDTVLYGTDKLIDKGKALMKHTVSEATGGLADPITRKVSNKHTTFFSKLDRPRRKKQMYYETLARKHGVDVIYGHSRGGAMAADLDVDATKIGVDAAMLIATNTDTLNLNEGGGLNPLGLFDEIIGITGEKNVNLDLSGLAPHKAWAT